MRVPAAIFVLNGTGELTGAHQIREWGLLETPILLTGTHGIPAASEGLLHFLLAKEPGIGRSDDVVLPVVGECDDSWLSDARRPALRAEHALRALKTARSGPVEEGSVGGGTGMISFGFKAGIGTASRVVKAFQRPFRVGVLVQSNFGLMRELRFQGRSIGAQLEAEGLSASSRKKPAGSIFTVLATDAPLLPHQLERFAKRAAMGLSRMGSHAAHGSGDLFLAFSTANAQSRRIEKIESWKALPNPSLDPFFEAVADATEEAIWNALSSAGSARGRSGHAAQAFPFESLNRS